MKKLSNKMVWILACAIDKAAYADGVAYFEVGAAKGTSKATIKALVKHGLVAYAEGSGEWAMDNGTVRVVPTVEADVAEAVLAEAKRLIEHRLV